MYGQILSDTGMLLNNELLQLVHLKLAKGESVKPHDHKGQEVFFTLISGSVLVTLEESEQHQLTPGRVLHFAGEARIGVEAQEDSEFFVYLINRK
ncbi:MAG: cupin domain-containing protein [Porphyromonas sp.]|nr:cupin domain-containing protein [Porphyromonas sp.]